MSVVATALKINQSKEGVVNFSKGPFRIYFLGVEELHGRDPFLTGKFKGGGMKIETQF